eukprot:8057622-Pyramimonas_sp.AAC.1
MFFPHLVLGPCGGQGAHIRRWCLQGLEPRSVWVEVRFYGCEGVWFLCARGVMQGCPGSGLWKPICARFRCGNSASPCTSISCTPSAALLMMYALPR